MAPTKISFEFFPPQSIKASFRLWDTAHSFSALKPRFVSVTYGAGGTTRKLTLDAVSALSQSTDFSVAAHLTCVGSSKDVTL